jgi:hypothetical protein
MFQPSDSDPSADNGPGMMTAAQRGKAAFERLLELLPDMGWDEDIAIDEIYDELGEASEVGRKAVEMWFNAERRSLPPYVIFNLGPWLGVDIAWLAGEPGITKEQATAGRRGLYHKEVRREKRRAGPKPRRPTAEIR